MRRMDGGGGRSVTLGAAAAAAVSAKRACVSACQRNTWPLCVLSAIFGCILRGPYFLFLIKLRRFEKQQKIIKKNSKLQIRN